MRIRSGVTKLLTTTSIALLAISVLSAGTSSGFRLASASAMNFPGISYVSFVSSSSSNFLWQAGTSFTGSTHGQNIVTVAADIPVPSSNPPNGDVYSVVVYIDDNTGQSNVLGIAASDGAWYLEYGSTLETQLTPGDTYSFIMTTVPETCGLQICDGVTFIVMLGSDKIFGAFNQDNAVNFNSKSWENALQVDSIVDSGGYPHFNFFFLSQDYETCKQVKVSGSVGCSATTLPACPSSSGKVCYAKWKTEEVSGTAPVPSAVSISLGKEGGVKIVN